MNRRETPLNRLVRALERAGCEPKLNGNGAGRAICPTHDDESPSLSIGEGLDGRALVKCHAGDGCTLDEICQAISLHPSDLFADEAHAVYEDEHGNPVLTKSRLPKKAADNRAPGKRFTITEHAPLFNLPDVKKWVRAGERICLVEGEKDCETLRIAGLNATTTPTGAGPWPVTAFERLRGAHVVMLPDNDEAGEQWLAHGLGGLRPVVASLRIVRLPDLPPKGDVTDWMLSHRDEDLVAAIEAAKPEDLTERPAPMPYNRVSDSVADPPPEPPVLVEGLLRAGESMGLATFRGVGKSWLAMDLSLALSRGEGTVLGKLEVRRAAKVLFCHGELGPWDAHSRWRHLASGGDMPANLLESFHPWRLRIVERSVEVEGGRERLYVGRIDPEFEALIAAEHVEVVFIDPWASFRSGSENDNDGVEAGLAELRRLSLAYGVSFVIIHHAGKAMQWREPEDLWRGASRLADWTSTRVTLLPHYTAREAEQRGLTRQEARRYVDVKFLRRGYPTPDYSMWFDDRSLRWVEFLPEEDEEGGGGGADLTPAQVAGLCPADGWPSVSRATAAIGVSRPKARELLNAAVRAGLLQVEDSGTHGKAYFRMEQPAAGTGPPAPAPNEDEDDGWSDF